MALHLAVSGCNVAAGRGLTQRAPLARQ